MPEHDPIPAAPQASRPPERPVAPRARRPADPPSEHRELALAFHAAPIGMAVTTGGGEIVQVNPALGSLLGVPPEHLLGHTLEDLADQPHAEAIARGRRQMLADGLPHHVADSSLLRADGRPVPVSLSCSRVQPDPADADDGGHIVVHVVDATDRRAAEAELVQRALHDPLTGLPNRVLLLDRLGVLLARLERHPSSVAVLFCDLNDFKQVNDRYGHPAGDRVIAEVGRRLRALQRSSDTACRYGGDEFVVVCADSGPAEAALVARRVHHCLRAPVRLDVPAVELVVGAAVGVATTRDAHASPEELLRRADEAMYRSKRG